jgi:hypothetical protein
MPATRRTLHACTVATIVACAAACAADDAVAWRDPVREGEMPDSVPAVMALARALAADSERFAAGVDAPPPLRDGSARGCGATLRSTPTVDGLSFAAWWAVRPDSGAVLVVARDSAGQLGDPVVVDARDRGVMGCHRPAPAIAYDARGGYVHLAYWLQPADGAGVFFAHSMDQGRTFHSPVAIVYGERPAMTSVAAHGDTVAVAFEEPNAPRPESWLALSCTAGHIFERHAVPVSGTDVSAQLPRVALGAGAVGVSWVQHTSPDDEGIRMIRVGTLRTIGARCGM